MVNLDTPGHKLCTSRGAEGNHREAAAAAALTVLRSLTSMVASGGKRTRREKDKQPTEGRATGDERQESSHNRTRLCT